MSSTVRAAIVLGILLALASSTALAQETRVGDTFTLSLNPPVTRFPHVAYDANNDAYLVTWGYVSHAIYARFVSADGTPLGLPVALDTVTPSGATGVACAAQISTCLVTWLQNDPWAVVGRLVTYNAGSVQVLSDPFTINGLAKQEEQDPNVAYSPASNEFLVVWGDPGSDVRAQRITGAGALTGNPINIAVTTLWEGNPSVTYNPLLNEFGVAYQYETTSGVNGIAVQRVSAGTGDLPVGRQTVMLSAFEQYPEIAFNPETGQYFVITWGWWNASTWMLHGQIVSGNADAVGSTIPLAAQGGGNGLGLAYNQAANKFFAVFQDHFDPEVWGVGVSADGVPDAGLKVTVSGTALSTQPSVASSGIAPRWLSVVSNNYRSVMGQLVSTSTVTPPTCTVDATATVPPFGGQGVAVAFAAAATPSGCGSATPTYYWDFGDGSPASTAQNPTHTYATAASYTWTLTVQAGTATASRVGIINVLPPGVCIPTTSVVVAKPPASLAQMWQGTGVTVTAGQAVVVTVAGAQTWVNGTQAWTAAGNAADPTAGTNSPMPGAPRMALVGRIGTTGPSFLVGTSVQLTADTTGQLFLAPNDDWYLTSDNSGSLNVSICASASTCAVNAAATVPAYAWLGDQVPFSATAAPSGCGTATPTYSWNFGDSSPAGTTQNLTHAYSSAGTFGWTLTVQVGAASTVKTGSINILLPGACIPSTATVAAMPATASLAAMWQGTGMTVTAGQQATVSVGGAQTWVSGGQSYTAAGNPSDVTSGTNVPMPGAPRMALVGRIGATGTPFLIGTAIQFTPTATGELYLAPNDDWYLTSDNSGSLNVSVCVGGTACSVDVTATVPTSGSAGSPVAFAATGTPSGCGSATPTYSWDFGDSSPVSTTQNPSHTYAVAGTYTWTLTVHAGTATATRTGSITISAAGACVPSTTVVLAQPSPQTLAAMWQSTGITVTAGQLVTVSVAGTQTWVNGGQSYTAAGNPSDLTSGGNVPMPGAPRMALVGRIGTTGAPFLVGTFVQFAAGASGPLFLAPNDDWYLLWDNSGGLSVSACAGGSACTVNAVATVPATAAPGDVVAFSGTCSPAGCGTATPTYSWNFGDGSPISSAQNPTHTYATAANYTWTLTVGVATATATVSGTIDVRVAPSCTPTTSVVLAQPSPQTLAAMWQGTGATIAAGQTVTITVAGTQSWTKGGQAWTAAGNAADPTAGTNSPMPGAPRMALVGRIGATGTPFLVGVSAQFTSDASGELFLAPNDDWYLLWDNSGSLSVSVCVGNANCSVGATATVPTIATAGAPVPFAATGTPSGCGSATPTYSWDFGDGSPASTSQNPTHAYANAGSYTWTLTVRADTATAIRTGTITVAPACTPTTSVVLAQPSPQTLAAMWQGTGVTVTSGNPVTITVSGSQTWTKGGQAWTAAGNPADPTAGTNSPMPGAPRMALVGRLGTSGSSFLVGTSLQFTAQATGQLYLAPNDDWYLLWNNAGSLTVTVCR